MNLCDCKPIELKDVKPGDIVHHAQMRCELQSYYLAIGRLGEVESGDGTKMMGVYFATIGRDRQFWTNGFGQTRPWIMEDRPPTGRNTLVLVERLT